MARSTYFYQVKANERPDKNAWLKKQIQTIYHRHNGRYGYRRITMAIRNAGHRVNHKTVQKIMQTLNLKSCVRIKKYHSYKGYLGKTANNLLRREFAASKPNIKWVTDVTEFRVHGQKLYLSPIMDLFNGEIIAYKITRAPVYGLIRDMLLKALRKLQPGEKPMLHSDQGWQYHMPDYRKCLKENGLIQSMSRKGNCLDNAAMESFFATLK